MASQKSSLNLRYLSVTSIVLGILGGAFFWWAPLGFVLSMSGLILGYLDWTRARRQSLSQRLAIVAMIVSLAALCISIAIMATGVELVEFGRR